MQKKRKKQGEKQRTTEESENESDGEQERGKFNHGPQKEQNPHQNKDKRGREERG